MRKFMNDDYMLTSEKAKELYGGVKDLPIYDYHCHLSPKEIYENKWYGNLTELWLDGDHYKWRVMRNGGVEERLITGDAAPYEKFCSFAGVLPDFIGNPVYHWAHLELKKYFNITLPICAQNAEEIWRLTAEQMKDGSFCARRLIEQSNVKTVVTTDDPVDELNYHKLLKNEGLSFDVLPCFRPDKAINLENAGFPDYVKSLEKASKTSIDSFSDLLRALEIRLNYFLDNGCVAADCSFENFPNGIGNRELAESAFAKALDAKPLNDLEKAEYKFCIMKALAEKFAKAGIVMQIHTGVLRNQNTARFKAIGADCGIDSAGNALDIVSGGRLFDAVEQDGGLPKTIVYTLNPNSYYPLATMLGDFAGERRGKLQLGAAWWFMDHRDGIKEQLRILSDTSALGLFNGMLTDSRSFTSYARHDYFRRILCSLVGEWVTDGEYPDDPAALGRLLENVCYYNAKNFFVREENK